MELQLTDKVALSLAQTRASGSQAPRRWSPKAPVSSRADCSPRASRHEAPGPSHVVDLGERLERLAPRTATSLVASHVVKGPHPQRPDLARTPPRCDLATHRRRYR